MRTICLPLITLCLAISDGFVPPMATNDITKEANTTATDLNGRRVPSLTESLMVGRGQYILLQDVNLINHLAHFNRERIPERVVHEKGAGAHGYFTVTHDITKYTRASVFAEIGKRTDVFVRFSPITRQSGIMGPINNPVGFSTKFYTDDGNWDLVGNNLPVFPIRDPILFPSFIHTQKRHPSSNLNDMNAVWDFLTLRPETFNFLLHLNSDLGFPDGYRFLPGYSVHAFKFVNETGHPVYVKFHWRTNHRVKILTSQRAAWLMATNPDYATQDLYEAIARGEFPSWKLFVQVMSFEEAASYKYHPFDATKAWLEEDFPLIPVGELVLNRNPVSYFAEVEQAAFDPGNLVTGIEMSPDPILAGRSFAYRDTQRYRLGVNFLQLPINSPKKKTQSYQRDGRGVRENGDGGIHYYPNSYPSPKVCPMASESPFKITGDVKREDINAGDDFIQPRIFFKSLSRGEQGRLYETLAASFDGVSERVLAKSIEVLKQLNETLGIGVHNALYTPRVDHKSCHEKMCIC